MKKKSFRKILGVTALCAAVYGGTIFAPAEEVTAPSTGITQDETQTPAENQESINPADSTAIPDSSSADTASDSQMKARDNVISYRFSPAIAAGTVITVSDADGNEVFSATAKTAVSMISFSAEGLAEGEYTIKAGNAEDTITVHAGQTFGRKNRGGHGNMGGKGWMPQMNGQPGAGQGSAPQAPGANGNNIPAPPQMNDQAPQMNDQAPQM